MKPFGGFPPVLSMKRRPHQLASTTSALHEPKPVAPALADEDRRAILGVCDCLIGRAGRTTLALALRGSRAKRVLQYQADRTCGYGFYAGRPEEAVLARIDALIDDGTLRIEYHDGFPLLGYTNRGLEFAMRYMAEEWLAELRCRVQPIAEGAALKLPFLLSTMPDRNHETVLRLTDLAGREANAAWLPLLRAWRAVETRRVRARLEPIIAKLERHATG